MEKGVGWTRKGNRKWGKARVECGGGQLGTENFSAADTRGICGDVSGVRPVWLIGTKGCVGGLGASVQQKLLAMVRRGRLPGPTRLKETQALK